MKKNTVYVAFCLLVLASGSAQARFWPWSSPIKRALKLDDGKELYKAAIGEGMGKLSPRKAARVLKRYIGEMNPALAKEVDNMIEAIDSGEIIPPAHTSRLAVHLEIDRISRIPAEGETLSKTDIETKALLEFLANDGRDEWIVKAIEEGELIVISTEIASAWAAHQGYIRQGYSRVSEFFEAEQLPQDEYVYFPVQIINENRIFLLASKKGHEMFNKLVNRLAEEKRAREAAEEAANMAAAATAINTIVITNIINR